MEDLVRLEIAMGLIITGLYEKEQKKIEGEYCYSSRLFHGINIFQNLNRKYNREKFDVSKLHEQAFITEYAMKPVMQWFEGWENTEALKLEEQFFYKMEAFVGDCGFNIFHVNDICEDYIEHLEKDLIAGIEQRAVYELLKILSQSDYVYLRKFLIEHPIIKNDELRQLKLKYSQNDIALQIIEHAYEEIQEDCYICPKCGWTMQKEKIGMRCQSKSCVEKKYLQAELKKIYGKSGMLRLKRGLMKYVAVPGKLELEIHKYCDEHKIQSKLWPYMDTFDVQITFADGEVWAIDAKAVRNPYLLREKYEKTEGFQKEIIEEDFM